MEFLFFDVGATLVFLLAYLTVVALQRRRAVPVATAARGTLGRHPHPAPSPDRRPSSGSRTGGTASRPRREWPRLSYPR